MHVWLFLFSKLLDDLRELNQLSGMLLFDSVYFGFGSEESLPGLSQLRETVVDH